MSNIIKPAAQVRAETQKNPEFETACASVMADIEKAKAEGRYHTLFRPTHYHLAEDLKTAFQLNGYEFRPVGVVAGVYQDDLYICW